MKQGELDRRFDHHPPDEHKVVVHQLIRSAFKDIADLVSHECPDCREKSLALTKLEEAMFWSNAAIARDDD